MPWLDCLAVWVVSCVSLSPDPPPPSPPEHGHFPRTRLSRLRTITAGLKHPLLCGQNAVDDVRLANPLARQERMGTGWFAVIMEYEGLVRGLLACEAKH